MMCRNKYVRKKRISLMAEIIRDFDQYVADIEKFRAARLQPIDALKE